jgi:hypothetical protein
MHSCWKRNTRLVLVMYAVLLVGGLSTFTGNAAQLLVPRAEAAVTEQCSMVEPPPAKYSKAFECTLVGERWFAIVVDSSDTTPQQIGWMLKCGEAVVQQRPPVMQIRPGIKAVKSNVGAPPRRPERAAGRLLARTTQPCTLQATVEPVDGTHAAPAPHIIVSWGTELRPKKGDVFHVPE